MTLSDSVAERLRAACAESAARERAARLAAARPLSKMELERKLIRKGQSAPPAEAAPTGWNRSARSTTPPTLRRSSVTTPAAVYGPMKLRDELRKRGVPRALWDGAHAQAPESAETLRAYLESRLRGRVPRRRSGAASPTRFVAGICMGGHRACPGEWEESI
jgi:regulatory protein